MPIIKRSDFAEKDILKDLNKELDTASKKVVKLTKANKALAESLNLIKKSSDGTEARKLSEATDKLTKSTKRLKPALTDVERVNQQILKENVKLANSRTKQAKQLALVRQETLKNNKANRDNAKSVLKMNKGLGGLAKSLLGTLGVVGGVMAFVNVLKNALKISVTFGKESSRLAAILKKTKGEISSLTDQAKDLGATTAFTASEVIKLQTELAKLGFSVTQIEAMTEGVLALAAATGTDLASSAELVGSTLKIFNLSASEAARVSDVLAKSTTISSLSMEKLATIMPIVGKTAQIAGLSLERTAALAGTLTDRGLDASSAGTSLRNIFLKLAKDGRTWNGAMEEMRGSSDKLKTSIDLFGVRASAAGIVLSETEADVNGLTTSLLDADGAAQQMADTMLDNLAGDITKANSAWEGFILSLADGEGTISKVLRTATSLFTNLLTALTELNDNVTLFESKFKRSERVVKFLDKATKKYTSDLKELTTNEEKLNFVHSKSIKLKQKLRGNTFALSKAEKELAEAGFLNKEALTEKVNQLKFNNLVWLEQIKILDKLTPSEKKQTDEVDKNTNEVNKNTEAVRRNNTARSGAEGIADSGEILGFTLPTENADSEFAFLDDQNTRKLAQEQKFLDDTQILRDEALAEEQRKAIQQAEDIEDAKKQIVDAAINAGIQIASDIFAAGQDDKINKLNQDAEAEKAILQNKLEQGLITEAQFKKKSAAIDKKVKLETAKADKKKAIFDIAIATAVGIARSIPNPVAMALAAALGAIQLAAVIARPLPKFEKGGKIGGKRHSQGGTVIEGEVDEFVLSRQGYAGAEGISDMINRGLIKDSDIGLLKNQGNYNPSMLQLNGLINKFDENIKNTHQTNKYLENLYSTHTKNGKVYITKSDGTPSQHTTS